MSYQGVNTGLKTLVMYKIKFEIISTELGVRLTERIRKRQGYQINVNKKITLDEC